MTAVASPPSFPQISRPQWGTSSGQGGLSSMNPDEVARMFMPRKSAQRANSSSSLSSQSSGSSTATATITQPSTQMNGAPITVNGDAGGWNNAARKKPQRAGPWPMNKSEPIAGVSTARPQSILSTNGTATAAMTSIQQPTAVVPSQHVLPTPSQQNGTRQATPAGEGNPVLYLLSMNGTFERKTITVPLYPDVLRIGRQTNIKTVPTPSNGFFDSKVLSRQHAEIWGDRNGKVWIRDVRSSNGTFVNGARLSPENRDSEPHELQTQDHLELGIDIVSEDQKTVVHHKVAAKVEHAGFLGAPTNILDMNFGDLDPANSALMLPSQNGIQARGRTPSQASIGSNNRMGPPGSVAMTNISVGQQRPMNFWLTPVTTEQIVKRLSHEMRTAKLQSNDLDRTERFFDTLLSKEEIKDIEKGEEIMKQLQTNGSSSSLRLETKNRFSDPPAPPPQQPLPEKPDVIRQQSFDPASPSLKRSTTERPRSVPSISPVRQEPTSQIITLVEALEAAKKELDSKSALVRHLEDLVQKEREARETAEGHLKRLELESTGARMNGFMTGSSEGRIVEEAFDPPPEAVPEAPTQDSSLQREVPNNTQSVDSALTEYQRKLDLMMVEMRQMKIEMEAYRLRAERAESEREVGRKTLAELVEKIRADEQMRQSSSKERATFAFSDSRETSMSAANGTSQPGSSSTLIREKLGVVNGMATGPLEELTPGSPLAVALSHPPGSQQQILYQSTPYASMIGVVLLGMGLMAYLNGWQKVER